MLKTTLLVQPRSSIQSFHTAAKPKAPHDLQVLAPLRQIQQLKQTLNRRVVVLCKLKAAQMYLPLAPLQVQFLWGLLSARPSAQRGMTPRNLQMVVAVGMVCVF